VGQVLSQRQQEHPRVLLAQPHNQVPRPHRNDPSARERSVAEGAEQKGDPGPTQHGPDGSCCSRIPRRNGADRPSSGASFCAAFAMLSKRTRRRTARMVVCYWISGTQARLTLSQSGGSSADAARNVHKFDVIMHEAACFCVKGADRPRVCVSVCSCRRAWPTGCRPTWTTSTSGPATPAAAAAWMKEEGSSTLRFSTCTITAWTCQASSTTRRCGLLFHDFLFFLIQSFSELWFLSAILKFTSVSSAPVMVGACHSRCSSSSPRAR
jgi:hypothetical protein